ncbi:MAG: hypothetical protein ABEK50_03790 [bacterium]
MQQQVRTGWYLGLILVAITLGCLVLALRDDYRFKPIIESNKDYYPALTVRPP